jgi:uncharacterized small protein (DUF1192 family)
MRLSDAGSEIMFEDENAPKPKAAFVPGQDVSLMSIADLKETIVTLKDEVIRLEAAIEAKQGTRASAESLFKF